MMATVAPKKRLIRILLPLGLLATGFLIFFALAATKAKPLPIKPQEQAWTVRVERIAPASSAPTLRLYGKVESPLAARLAAAVPGDVRAMPAREGRAVRKGELLVQLDDRDLRLVAERRAAELKEVEARLASERERHRADQASLRHEEELLRLARAQLDRTREVAARKLAPQSLVDEAQSTLERQALALESRRLAVQDHPSRLAALEAQRDRVAADLAQARLDVERTRIVAPFAGRIAKVRVAPGDRIASGAVVVELYDPGALEARAQIPAAYLPLVRAALAAGTRPRAHGNVDGKPVTLEVDRLAAQVEKNSAGIDALLRAREGANVLSLGRVVEVTLELPPQPDTVAVPFDAVYGRSRVYVLESGRMRGVNVEVIGEQRRPGGETRLLVRSPELRPGTALITTQLPQAMDGLKVKVAGY